MASKKTKAEPSKRPITPDDLFSIDVVGDPRLSPDGKTAAYVVTRLNKEADEYRAAIWLAPVTGGEPVRLTSGAARDTAPALVAGWIEARVRFEPARICSARQRGQTGRKEGRQTFQPDLDH